ncbi:MAG TPA: bifunctional serine/threonine-protein kinase/formylglycine-generating enzyme family protein, partial [Xanthomonadaceae bacterium]|nr:bifunctional serine/threonine-protein kinase/formylglycine-generating enzyme family protein [Xanthomonadaceae bacterium]
HAHARGVVHRDVKAENVLFDEAERPLLADFGIALRRFGPRVTTAGMAVGSTAYMAPEQARGEEVDARADLYAVGVLAWEMLTGQLPYMAGDALSMAVMHAQDPIPRLPRPLRHWQRFFDRALAKSPAQRFRNAQQMREALDRVPRHGGSPMAALRDGGRHAIAGMRRWPITVWLGLMLLVAAGVGIGLREMNRAPADGFFRAVTDRVAGALPTPGARPGQPVVGEPLDPTFRPLPQSPAEPFLAAAEQQLRTRNLTAPSDRNATDSLLAAWKADPHHPRLAADTTSVIDALADEGAQRVRDGDGSRARDYLDRASRLAAVAGKQADPVLARMRARLDKALDNRMAEATSHADRAGAQRVVDSARALGMPVARIDALAARAKDIPSAGDALPGDASMRLVRSGDGLVALALRQVDRADYARFANSTARDAALCRQRISLLRLVRPISWQAPGFVQTPAQPVVCVSWADANAYAQWLGRKTGFHYRLPRAAEARALPATEGGRAVGEWLGECGNGCSEHLSGGRSWRGGSGTRPLDGSRGYDDVGFRLVREL